MPDIGRLSLLVVVQAAAVKKNRMSELLDLYSNILNTQPRIAFPWPSEEVLLTMLTED
jgi:hypothetical protein